MEGVIQGYPLAMVVYSIGIIPLIKHLELTYPDVAQTWYSDDAGSLGTFNNLERCFNLLKRNGLDRGHYPGSTISISVVHPKILKQGGFLAGFTYLRCESDG